MLDQATHSLFAEVVGDGNKIAVVDMCCDASDADEDLGTLGRGNE